MATVSPPSTTRMFSNLTPFTQYRVTITAVDSMGRQGDFIIITVTTNRAGSYLQCVYISSLHSRYIYIPHIHISSNLYNILHIY